MSKDNRSPLATALIIGFAAGGAVGFLATLVYLLLR